MLPLLEGIQAGLLLSILIGPIFFALIQTTIEQGTKAGLVVGTGIWLSDALFIIAMFFGVTALMELVEWGGFEQTFGSIGGLILLITGIGTIFTKPQKIGSSSSNPLHQIKGLFSLFFKGFLINSINPFTFFFWMSTMSMANLKETPRNNYTFLFFSGVFMMIILTDVLKVFLAEKIRKRLTYDYLVKIRIISGIALGIFGLVLIGRVWLF